jgi:hypothetical protein
MNRDVCEREHEAARALRSGAWTANLREHVASCEACGQALLLAGWLLESEERTPLEVTPPGLAWRRVQLRLKRDNSARAQRPLVIAERLAAALFAVALIAAVTWIGGIATAAFSAALVLFALAAVSVLVFAASRR